MLFRSSGVPTPLAGEKARIFAAVVKPERVKADGGSAAAVLNATRGTSAHVRLRSGA